jgi:hypothetical protein
MSTQAPSAHSPARGAPASVAVDAARDAIEHTRQLLFPFRLERWALLGLVAWLDQCGRNGGFGPFNVFRGGGSGGDDGHWLDPRDALAWMSGHLGLLLGLAALGVAVMLALTALALWVGSRGIFVYLDNVATGQAQIRRPWDEHAERANSLFAVRFGLALASFLLVVLILIAAAGTAFLVSTRGPALPLALIGAALLALPMVLLVALAAGLTSLALRDFVAPLQWLYGLPCAAAARLALEQIRASPGPFLVYLLLKIALAVLAVPLVVIACCALCCCALIPGVVQTLLQPLLFFERALSLCLLRRLGHDLLGTVARAAAPDTPSPS